ncbi:hypothetical protein BU17DRAFT_63395 [Hysterangium stoloniferum]|nr:hypothetical protein BU17DRAFT_63395 [Hysterangium stoloniferum]
MDSSTTLVTSPSPVISPNKKGKLARSATIDEEEMHTGFDWELSPPGKTLASLSTSGSSESLKPKPMVPNASSRYDPRKSPESDNIPIPAGPPSMNRGRPRTEVYDTPVVTEANICDDVVKIRVVDLAQRLMDQFNSEGWHFKDTDVELFVTVSDDENDSGSYYFLHHGENVIFWLEKVTNEDIGDRLIAPFSGSDHLRIHLHHFYWVHQEYFPHHLVAETFTVADLPELLSQSVGRNLTQFEATVLLTGCYVFFLVYFMYGNTGNSFALMRRKLNSFTNNHQFPRFGSYGSAGLDYPIFLEGRFLVDRCFVR